MNLSTFLQYNIVNTHKNITIFLHLITLEKYNMNFIKRIWNFLLPITAANWYFLESTIQKFSNRPSLDDNLMISYLMQGVLQSFLNDFFFKPCFTIFLIWHILIRWIFLVKELSLSVPIPFSDMLNNLFICWLRILRK